MKKYKYMWYSRNFRGSRFSAFHSYMSRGELLEDPLVIAQGCYQENSFILFTVNPGLKLTRVWATQPRLPWSTCGHLNRFYTVPYIKHRTLCLIWYPDIKTFKFMDSINWCLSKWVEIIVNNHDKDSENNVNLLFKPRFPHYGRHGKAYLTFAGKKYFR